MRTATADIARTTHTIEGVQVSVRRGGSGPTLLFLHGNDAFAAWQPFMTQLAEHFDVIVPDHPGFGVSDTPKWLDSIGDLAHFYRAFIEALGLTNVILAGNDLGGWIAAELALRDTKDLRALILVDAAGLPLAADGIDTFMCSPDELRRASYVDAARGPELDDALRSQLAKNALMTARLAWTPRFYDPQLAKWLHRLRIPTLVVWGAADEIFPVAHAAAFSSTIPGARTAVIPNAGHLPHVEAPAAFAAAVTAFIDGGRP
jgi:pimeloyl-ACP methyl ester carboxylesterase